MAVEPSFEWDAAKSRRNEEKHGVGFIAVDLGHSGEEQRFYCFGRVHDGIMTVRFTWRDGRIRIFGAGYWRKGRKVYERENKKIHGRRDRQSEGG
jgi:uncharacterized DUF497 family protein